MNLQNPKTTIFGTLAAVGGWAHQSGLLINTPKIQQLVAILTAGCLALAAFYAKDKHAEDFQKVTTEEVKKEITTTTEKL